MDWEFGISRCKLVHIEWTENMVLVGSTENCIQYPIINHNEKEHEKEYIYVCVCACVCVCVCVCVTESLCSTAAINTTL